MGAKAARGKYFLFLNNDIEVITPSWVKNLVAICGLTGVGVVGGKLLYPNGKIQHAGIVLGLEGHASHVFHGSRPDRHSPFGSVDWYRNYSAVTGACMLIRKEVFSELKGFDEKFVLIFNDVDLCLRAWKKGYRTVYNPEVVLLHHEGSTREKYNPSSDVLLGYERFQKCIEAGDPYFNPNLSRAIRIPTTKKKWESDPLSRIEKIIKFDWY
jgi:GT2 family glycosyltransferase